MPHERLSYSWKPLGIGVKEKTARGSYCYLSHLRPSRNAICLPNDHAHTQAAPGSLVASACCPQRHSTGTKTILSNYQHCDMYCNRSQFTLEWSESHMAVPRLTCISILYLEFKAKYLCFAPRVIKLVLITIIS